MLDVPYERIGFLDIEASNLKADFGICFCYVIKTSFGITYKRCVTPNELKTCLDRNVVRSCIEDISEFDRIVGHYSSRFDIPFLRARALKLGLEFPPYGSIKQTDTWAIARRALCISSNRLGNIADLFNIRQRKTRITSEHWLAALTGSQKSLDYILRHCEIDVELLMKVYKRLKPFIGRQRMSI